MTNLKKENNVIDLELFSTDKEGIFCSIIIPVYNNIKFTKSAVEDLLNLPNNYEIVVVDNGSTDDTPYVIEAILENRTEEQAHLLYINCNKNLFFGRANNKGYKHSNGEYVIFLNNDIKVEDRLTDWPLIMIEEAKKGFLVCTQGAELDDGFNFVKEASGLKQSKYWYASGWCLCAKREVFDKLILNHFAHDETDEICEGRSWGPWNEKLSAKSVYFEDVDLTWRAKEFGFNFKEVEIPVHHFGRMTGKKMNISYMYKISRRIFKKIWLTK